MLRNTFCHIPRVGLRLERRLWNGGIVSWDDAIELAKVVSNEALRGWIGAQIGESYRALERLDGSFFLRTLPPSEHWRIFPEFRDRTAYIDIETNGPKVEEGAIITTATLYDGREVHHYTHGENLRDLRDDLDNYALLITYNGKAFDLPFIENYFKIRLQQAHIDLRLLLHSLGITGGLKGSEKQLGIDRGELAGVDGYTAVLLWREFERSGDRKALETLLAYNSADAVNLEHLMLAAYNMKLATTPFNESLTLSFPDSTPQSPYLPDSAMLERIRSRRRGR